MIALGDLWSTALASELQAVAITNNSPGAYTGGPVDCAWIAGLLSHSKLQKEDQGSVEPAPIG
jgi:hypothetical protein